MHKPILTAALLATIGVAALLSAHRAATLAPPQPAFAALAGPPTSWIAENQRQVEQVLHPDDVLERMLSWQPHDYTYFIHPETGLTFSYPIHFTSFFDVFPDGDLVIFQDTKLGIGIQLFTQKFDEPPEALTNERIRRDLPDLEMTDLYIFPLYAGRADLRFKRHDPVLGTVREHWIAADGYLSQLTVYAPASLLDSYFRGLINEIKFVDLTELLDTPEAP